jgi:hypothetical protein
MATRKLGFSPLMKAIYTRLTTYGLTSAYRVYNYVPTNAVMPYVSFGAPIGVRSASFTTRDTEAEENSVTIHAWSAVEGDKEASEYMDNIVQAILSSGLTITGYFTPYLAQLEMSELFIDDSVPTKLVRHGVLRFRFVMAPN